MDIKRICLAPEQCSITGPWPWRWEIRAHFFKQYRQELFKQFFCSFFCWTKLLRLLQFLKLWKLREQQLWKLREQQLWKLKE